MDGLRVEHKENAIVLAFAGEITLEVTSNLKKEVERVLDEEEFDALVFDLSEVTFMDSSGIGFLVAQNTRIKGLGKPMFLYQPSRQVAKTLDLVQLSSFFHILEDEDDLMASLPG